MGLEEHLDGVLSAYWSTQGVIAMGCEGGQHDDPGSVDNLEAVLLLGAESAGIFGAGTIIETAAAHATPASGGAASSRTSSKSSRVARSRKDDEFVMEPGFPNLAAVARWAHPRA